MSNQHRATPEQWDYVDVWGVVHDCAPSSCILELRSRIEALEAMHTDKLDRLIELDRDDPAMTELRAASAEARPAGRLVERIADTIGGGCGWESEARAAIREVAKWLEEQENDLYQLSDALNLLEQEADRG